jgi:hypothetical protein
MKIIRGINLTYHRKDKGNIIDYYFNVAALYSGLHKFSTVTVFRYFSSIHCSVLIS